MQNNISLDLKIKQLEDIIVHKQFILEAGHKLSSKLFEIGEDENALKLLKNIFIHDMSKLQSDEFYGMAKFPGIEYSYAPEEKVKVIQKHWQRNPHHPEYWMDEIPNTLMNEEGNNIKFPDDSILIMEMCCDWYARSLQLKNSVKVFFETHAKVRWTFPIEVERKIIKYLDLLEK